MTDLDAALREMLRERAQDITTVPSRLLDLDTGSEPRRPRPNYWLIAAAVAAVLALAAGIALFVRRDDTSPPATPRIVNRPTCSTTLPAAWRAALTADPARAHSESPLAVTSDGTTLVTRDRGFSRDIIVETPTEIHRPVIAEPAVDHLTARFGAFTGQYAVVGWVQDGDSAVAPLRVIDVIKLDPEGVVRSITVTTAADIADHTKTSTGMAVAGGLVY